MMYYRYPISIVITDTINNARIVYIKYNIICY